VVTGIPYEVVNTDASIHKVGGQVQLTGYGCTVQGGSGGNDGIYRVGEASITRLPSSTSNDIITKGNVALCYGDSGGSAFQYLDAAKTKRVLISINSRGDIKTTSYLSSVSTPKAKQFIQDWTSRQGLRMCGVHADAKGCRDSGPVFELPQVCVDAKAKSDLLESCMFDETTPGMSECRDAVDLTSACVEARQQ